MLKVGDKVRVIKGLKRFENSKVGINEDMLQFEEEIVTIIGVKGWGDILIYSIKEDEEEYYWVEEMFEKIEEKESNNMKEITFREVIANIKEDEIWEGREYTITLLGNRIAINYNDGDEYNGVYPLIEGTFKLKRPQYTFQEAFKAFEEGKEIESCESGDIYNTTEEDVEDKLFCGYEIQGKWYIND